MVWAATAGGQVLGLLASDDSDLLITDDVGAIDVG